MSAAAKRLHARPVLPRLMPPVTRCEETGKRGYEAKADAISVAARASKAGPQRAYLCEFCERWHLTTQPKRRVPR